MEVEFLSTAIPPSPIPSGGRGASIPLSQSPSFYVEFGRFLSGRLFSQPVFLTVCLSACRSVRLSVCLFLSVCLSDPFLTVFLFSAAEAETIVLMDGRTDRQSAHLFCERSQKITFNFLTKFVVELKIFFDGTR